MNLFDIVGNERNPRKFFELLVNSNKFTGAELYDIGMYMFKLLCREDD